jgi:short subunit dehydrogenase-like uncharacterized protein
VRSFDVAGTTRTAVSIPGSEHFALTRSHPRLREVGVFLGLPPLAAHGLRAGSLLTAALAQVPPLKRGLEGALARSVKGSTGGPDARARGRSRARVVAEALDDAGNPLATVTLVGGDPYDFTAAILAWGAETALGGGLLGTGALGPVDAFGLDSLHTAVLDAGWTRHPAG